MATAQTHTTERRHIPDRRANSKAAHSTAPMSALDWAAMTLLIIGGINWGLVGLFAFDLVAAIFGEMTLLSRIVYTLVGLSAVYCIFTSTKLARKQT
jgi:uncharacterized membrane protein YuzA (DUF378 family)